MIDDIEDSKFKHQACQYLRRSLKHAISCIEESTSTVKSELTQLQDSVSTQKDAVAIPPPDGAVPKGDWGVMVAPEAESGGWKMGTGVCVRVPR